MQVSEIWYAEERVWFPAFAGTSLDPRSRPAWRDLAGMTYQDTAYREGELAESPLVVTHSIYSFLVFQSLYLYRSFSKK